jgi:hypothetical protein
MDGEAVSAEMSRIDLSAEYFAITLLGLENGRIERSAFSHFVNFTRTKPQREIREASLVKPDLMADTWRTTGKSYIVVAKDFHVAVFSRIGGNALVERSVAKRWFADVIAAREVASETLGYRSIESLPRQALNHAPTPKLRMSVIERDCHRCRICGERPADNVHVTLHVHHIRQWGDGGGGLTVAENLITVCHTCHLGLVPHYKPVLFSLIGASPFAINTSEETKKYWRGVERYQNLMREVFEQLDVGA